MLERAILAFASRLKVVAVACWHRHQVDQQVGSLPELGLLAESLTERVLD